MRVSAWMCAVAVSRGGRGVLWERCGGGESCILGRRRVHFAWQAWGIVRSGLSMHGHLCVAGAGKRVHQVRWLDLVALYGNAAACVRDHLLCGSKSPPAQGCDGSQ